MCFILLPHYSDVIMVVMASQITSLTIVLTVYSGGDQRKNQSSASLAFVQGIHRSSVNSPHKWPVTRKMFPFDDVIMFEDDVLKHTSHGSITLIKQHNAPCENLRFRVASHENFKCHVDPLKSDKAAGFDALDAKFLKLSGNKYISFICDVFNIYM